MRKTDEINEYMDQAADMVWLMRTCPCAIPEIEKQRKEKEQRILEKYNIKDLGFHEWDCGYWNGILGTLRWVLGDEQNSLDT